MAQDQNRGGAMDAMGGAAGALVDVGTGLIDKGTDVLEQVASGALGAGGDVAQHTVNLAGGTIENLKNQSEMTVSELAGLIRDLNGRLRDALKGVL